MNLTTRTNRFGPHFMINSCIVVSVHLPLCKRGIEGDLSNKISTNPSFPKRGTERLRIAGLLNSSSLFATNVNPVPPYKKGGAEGIFITSHWVQVTTLDLRGFKNLAGLNTITNEKLRIFSSIRYLSNPPQPPFSKGRSTLLRPVYNDKRQRVGTFQSPIHVNTNLKFKGSQP